MPTKPTACLALADGSIFYGLGFGAIGQTTAELCFNTAMTGYQEIMTDTSYAGQVVTFTFPHIGNVGVNPDDDETADPVAAGMVGKWEPTEPSNWRAAEPMVDWLTRRGRIGIGGVDTRRLTRAIRQQGAPHVALAHDPEGRFDLILGCDVAYEAKLQEPLLDVVDRYLAPGGVALFADPGRTRLPGFVRRATARGYRVELEDAEGSPAEREAAAFRLVRLRRESAAGAG